MSSSKGLIGGLSSIVQEKKDKRRERKTKRKKKIKKKENKNTRAKTEGGKVKTDKKDAPVVQDLKLKTKRKLICFVERVKKRSEGRNTISEDDHENFGEERVAGRASLVSSLCDEMVVDEEASISKPARLVRSGCRGRTGKTQSLPNRGRLSSEKVDI